MSLAESKSLKKYEPIAFDRLADLPILVVDDLLLLRQLIENYLRKEGFTNISLATNGRDALEKVEEVKPAIVILDIMMPEMDGFEVCQELRKQPKYDNMPIIIQTGLEEAGERLRIFQEGANDLLIKPINGAELVARTKVHLQNSLLQSELRANQERMSNELAAALEIQMSLMPDTQKIGKLETANDLEIGAHYWPSSEIGGDLWGVEQISDHKIGIYLVDFTGHGVASALNTFRLHTLLSDSDWDWEIPEVWLQELNQRLCKVLSVGQFATVFYAVIDTENEKLTYASAGAPPVVFTEAGDQGSRLLETAGLPIGITAKATYDRIELDFPKQSQMLFYSDAYVETAIEKEQMLTEEDLLRLSQEIHPLEGGDARISHLLEAFPGRKLERIPDDLTLVTILNKKA